MSTNSSPNPDLSRRTVIAGITAGSAFAASGLALPPSAEAAAARAARRETSFDAEWLFFRGTAQNAQAVGYDDSTWRRLTLPHDYSIEDLPGGSDDGKASADSADAVTWTLLDQAISPAPAKIGPFDQLNTPGGPYGMKGGKQVGYTTNGEAWYRKHFAVADLASGDRVEIQFDGAYCYVDVWLNDQHLGFVANGSVPFHFDLTPHLNPAGDNVMAVRVRNVGMTSRWYNGSGINRHTRLVVTRAVRIPRWGVRVTTPTVTIESADVVATVDVENFSQTSTLKVRSTVLGPDGRQLSTATTPGQVINGQGSFRIQHSLSRPALWSVDSPRLHSLRTEVLSGSTVLDTVVEAFGVRSIRFGSDGFFLNGTRVKLRGGNVHGDHGPLGSVAPYRAEERRVQDLKAVGFNAIRAAHNCPTPEFLKACDRLGVLVYEEFTDMWDDGKNDDDYHLYFADNWRADMARWVANAHNHPSVVIRSIGNEIGYSLGTLGTPEQRYARSKELADEVRRLDPTRPVTQGGASNQASPDPTGHLDVGDVHYLHDYSANQANYPGKAFLQSESYPATLFEDWMFVAQNEYAVGDFTWTAVDYIGEAAIGAPLAFPPGTEPAIDPLDAPLALGEAMGVIPYPYYASRCGDLDLIGERRGVNLYRNVVWGLSDLELAVERPTPGMETQAIGWSWYDELESWTWDVLPGEPLKARVYTTGDQVELRLNGVSIAMKSMADADKRIATFSIPYAPGTLTAIARKGGVELARRTLRTTGLPAALRLTADRPSITTSADDLSYVLVEVVDIDGNVVPDAVVQVQFGVAGGKLMGVANGNAHNVDSFQRPRRWTYHGKALAIIAPPRTSGSITVNAFSAGLTPDAITVGVIAGSYPSA